MTGISFSDDDSLLSSGQRSSSLDEVGHFDGHKTVMARWPDAQGGSAPEHGGALSLAFTCSRFSALVADSFWACINSDYETDARVEYICNKLQSAHEVLRYVSRLISTMQGLLRLVPSPVVFLCDKAVWNVRFPMCDQRVLFPSRLPLEIEHQNLSRRIKHVQAYCAILKRWACLFSLSCYHACD